MRALNSVSIGVALLVAAGAFGDALAAGAVEGGGRQALNIPAIVMFFIFVAATLAAEETLCYLVPRPAILALPDQFCD